MTDDFKIIKVDRFDSKAIRHAFDDIVKQIFCNRLNGRESHQLVDRRLMISTLAVLFSAFACGYDYYDPYPGSKYVLATCSISYFILTGLLQLYQWYIEKEIFLVFYEKLGKKELKWEVSSDIGKYDNIYKISFKLINDEGSDKVLKYERCISKFMDVEGQVLFRDLENFVMNCRGDFKLEKKAN
jgi:signal peptidase complex subunit 2